MILIITPVYRSYNIVKECCEAIDKHTVNSYLHILIDDDSGIDEPFPIKPSPPPINNTVNLVELIPYFFNRSSRGCDLTNF